MTEKVSLQCGLQRILVFFFLQDKPNRENDMRLAQHITYVHTHNKAPDVQGNREHLFDMALLRKFLAACRRINPVVSLGVVSKKLVQFVGL